MKIVKHFILSKNEEKLMKRSMMTATFIAACLSNTTVAQETLPAVTSTEAGTQDSRAQARIALKDRQLDDREAKLKRENPNGRIPDDNPTFTAGIKVNPQLGVSPAVEQALMQQFSRDVRVELATLGYNRGVLQSRGNNDALRTAIVKKVRGTADLSDLALLADTVVIGKVTAIDMANPDLDGFGGRAIVNVERNFEGSVDVGEELIVRLTTGQVTADRFLRDESEFIPAVGDTVAVVASNASYRVNRRIASGRDPSRDNTVIELADFYIVEGDRLISRSSDPILRDSTVAAFQSGAQ